MRAWFVLGFLGSAMVGSGVQASSEEAWAAFVAEVAEVCLALPDAPKGAAVEVSPFGSQSYGAALVTSISDGVLVRQVCIFDKARHTAELAAPFLTAP